MDLRGKNAALIGLGRSGVAAAELLLAKGAKVTAADMSPKDRLSPEARRLADRGVTLELGPHPATLFDGKDLAVISPGVPSFSALEAFERRGGLVIGELELASWFVTAPIALIGGTNGKSTTTALSAAMMAEGGRKTFLGGNFGTPLAEVTADPWDVLVIEISSFQAERVPTLHARVHALLNITDDHLDRYPDFAAYAHAKGNPFAQMTEDDIAVIPRGDVLVAREAERGSARTVTFSERLPADVCVEGDKIVDHLRREAYPLDLLKIKGSHNVANACAAIAVAAALGASPAEITRALAAFEGLGHRTVLVGEHGGVRFYDDSKGTNVGASVAALRGLAEPRAVLIAGGRDKLGAYDPLVDALRDRGRALVVIGEAADRIAGAARGALPIVKASTMREAVEAARELAQPGDAVLLSPACSSFDMFRDYKERGDVFAQAVRDLLSSTGAGGAA